MPPENICDKIKEAATISVHANRQSSFTIILLPVQSIPITDAEKAQLSNQHSMKIGQFKSYWDRRHTKMIS
jgi:hypothetical protein